MADCHHLDLKNARINVMSGKMKIQSEKIKSEKCKSQVKNINE
jgi:hypothetical protein